MAGRGPDNSGDPAAVAQALTACSSGKLGYKTAPAAYRAAKRMKRLNNTAYRCRFCHDWHLTSRKKDEQPPRKG